MLLALPSANCKCMDGGIEEAGRATVPACFEEEGPPRNAYFRNEAHMKARIIVMNCPIEGP